MIKYHIIRLDNTLTVDHKMIKEFHFFNDFGSCSEYNSNIYLTKYITDYMNKNNISKEDVISLNTFINSNNKFSISYDNTQYCFNDGYISLIYDNKSTK